MLAGFQICKDGTRANIAPGVLERASGSCVFLPGPNLLLFAGLLWCWSGSEKGTCIDSLEPREGVGSGHGTSNVQRYLSVVGGHLSSRSAYSTRFTFNGISDVT